MNRQRLRKKVHSIDRDIKKTEGRKVRGGEI